MKIELNYDYDISGANMLSFSSEDEKNGFKLETNGYYVIADDNIVEVDILINDNKQIFRMKDGIFILEVEEINDEGNDIKYYYSYNLDDLMC